MVADNDYTGTVQRVKSSCLASLEATNIRINSAGIETFLSNLTEEDYLKFYLEHGYRFPLNFSSLAEELNFMTVVSLLNFLSAYRVELHALGGKGAFDTIRRFCLSAFLANEDVALLSAKGMATLTEAKTAELLDISLYTEKKHETLPVTLSERNPDAVEIVGLVKGACNRTGSILLQAGCSDLGNWMMKTLDAGKELSAESRTDHLVHAVVATFPDFQDEGLVGEAKTPVYLYKKALLAAHITATTFADRDAPFPLPATAHLPVFCDNLLPTMANHYNFLDLSSSIYPKFANGLGESSTSLTAGLSVSHEEAYAIRSATVAACERAVEIAQRMSGEREDKKWLAKMTAVDLDGYLWAKAKDGELRNVPRLSEKGTTFY